MQLMVYRTARQSSVCTNNKILVCDIGMTAKFGHAVYYIIILIIFYKGGHIHMTGIGMVPLELGMPFYLYISTPERHNLYNTHNFHDPEVGPGLYWKYIMT